MNICAFGKSLPVHGIGGLELHFETITRGLARRGHSVTAVTTRHPAGLEIEAAHGVEVHYLPGTVPGCYELGYWRKSRHAFTGLNTKNPFDVVLSESAGAYGYLRDRLRKRHDQPVLFIAHGTSKGELRSRIRRGIRSPRALIGSLYNIYCHVRDRRLFPHLDAVVCVSDFVRDSVRDELGVDESKLSVIPNGVDTELFRPDGAIGARVRSALGIGSDERVLLCVGRLQREKGIEIAIQAIEQICHRVSDARLVIVGTGRYERTLKSIAADRELGNRVLFAGRVAQGDLPGYYNASDLLLLPSMRDEGLPLTLLEGVACGKPVVAFDSGGIGTAVRDGRTGFLLEPGDLTGLVDRSAIVLNDAELAEKMGRYSRRMAEENFASDRMVERIEAALLETIQKSGRSSE